MAATAAAATTADAAIGSNSGLQISFRVEGPKRLAKDLLLLLAEPCLLLLFQLRALYNLSSVCSVQESSTMALKRARLDPTRNPWAATSSVTYVGQNAIPNERLEAAREAGISLRKLLLGKHVAGEYPANDVCKLAFLHTNTHRAPRPV